MNVTWELLRERASGTENDGFTEAERLNAVQSYKDAGYTPAHAGKALGLVLDEEVDQ